MSAQDLSKLATDLLAEEPLVEADTSAEREERMARAITDRIRERRGRRRRAAMALGALAVAAVALVGIGRAVTSRATPGASASVAEVTPGSAVVRGGTEAPLASRDLLREGDRVRAAASGDAVVALTDGSRVRVGASGEVSIAELATTRRFVLTTGALRADVHKLRAGERFVVTTGDAEVEVHGTSFEVSLAPTQCRETRTRVHVYEGVVAVRSAGVETRLFAGEDWPRGCVGAEGAIDGGSSRAPAAGTHTAPEPGRSDPSAPAGTHTAPGTSAPSGAATATAGTTASPTAPATAPATATAAATAGPTAAATASPVAPEGTVASPRGALAEQNDLFARATAARRRGDEAAAVAAYEELLARHPGGSLAEAATVERMRALEKLDHGRAVAAARAYLARYPRGFARAEAAQIAR